MRGETFLILEGLAILMGVLFFFALSRIPPNRNKQKRKKDDIT